MNKTLASLVLVGLLGSAGAQAELPNIDECTGCHGRDGRSNHPENPNIAGQKELYIIKALKDFRIGERRHLMMNYVARNLSDDDIAELAAYYASFKPAPPAEEWR